MEYILQISTGGFSHKSADFDAIRARMDYCMDRLRVKAVLIGWAIDSSLYRQVCNYLKDRCPVYLWLPVFSEVGDVCKSDPSIGFMGGCIEPIRISAGENFVFICPSSAHNHKQILRIYDEHFADCGFDGVFLDKIRFAAFSNSYENAFGCFCKGCRPFYESCGVDLDAVFTLLKERNPYLFMPESFEMARYTFREPLIELLFAARTRLITASVSSLAVSLRERGLKVALDTFAPVVSWFVGQDIAALANVAEFIKPMIYRVSQEPAGISYEFRHLFEKLGFERPELLRREFETILGSRDVVGDDLYKSQLLMLKGAACPIVPGIEVNHKAGCHPTTEYLLRSVKLASSAGCDTLVLAWDILSAPDEHIACLA